MTQEPGPLIMPAAPNSNAQVAAFTAAQLAVNGVLLTARRL